MALFVFSEEKMSVNLAKGQKISLAKEAGAQLTKIVMGLGWDPIKKKGVFGLFGGQANIDLDASCLMFDDNQDLIDVIWFGQLESRDGSIIHTGDNRSGAGDGDDEQIIIDLSKIPGNIKSLVFTVNSFTGQNFSKIDNATCRIINAQNNSELARYKLSCQGVHTAQIMTKVYRHQGEWKIHAIGENCDGHTFMNLIPYIKLHL